MMKTVVRIASPIVDLDRARLLKQVRTAYRTMQYAEGEEIKYRDLVAARRLELGTHLIAARRMWPARGPNAKGWGEFLVEAGIDQDTALVAMKYAGYVQEHFPDKPGKLPTLQDAGLDKRPRKNDEGDEPNRDAYCTPEPIVKALPKKLGTDPCSNPHSLVIAENMYSLETGEDGLKLPWIRLTYVNGPFSGLLPFAEKLHEEKSKPRATRTITGAGFMVNADHSPEWWRLLIVHLHIRLDFDDRLDFKPPPGVVPSKNDRPQSLLMDKAFWAACDRRAFLKMGTLWIKQPKA